ncbi:MAG: integrase arm-type DNA-binding domain-containing protein, partial [Gemmatimonadota bacterium]
MPSQRLTDRSLRALKTEGQRVEVWDKTLPGFGVRVSETGRKVFIVRYRAGGKRRRVRVGRYPETSLADARDRARVLLGQVVGGDDPVRAHREGKTFGELADIYLERYAKKIKREKSWREDERQLEKDVLPAWRDRPASGITRADVHELLDRIADRAPVLANRTRALLSKIFNFGIERDLVSANPVRGMSRPTKERPRRRVLTDEEIRTLWEALVDEPPLIAASFKLRLITAQRGGEVLSMRHEDIQGDEWLIPAEHFKSDRPHLVPLSPQAIAVLEEIGPMAQGSPWVFPARGPAGHIQWLSTATTRIRKRTGFHWTPHDLRRTAATNMTKMGVPRFVVGRVLGHAVHDVTGVYDVYDYAAEKRDALESWGERLDEICRAKTEPKSGDTHRVLQPGGHGVGPRKFVGPYAASAKAIYENWAATRAKTEPKSGDTHRAAGPVGVGPMKRWSSAM